MGRGHLSLGTITEPGSGGVGSFVYRNNDSNCRTRERGEGLFVSRNNNSNCRTRERGHLSLGTMILTVEPGRGVICL